MKRSRLVAVAVAALALTAAVPAQARTSHHRWYAMTLRERRAVVVHEIRVQRAPVRWWLRHARRWPASSATALPFCHAIGVPAPGVICAHGQRLVHALGVLRRIDENIAARAAAQAASAFPPHHALWTCIGGFEGSPTSVNPNGHYGMLQMTWNWLGYIQGAASSYPQAVQEWAAERAYRDSGYSISFLYGQWLDYDGAASSCLRYA